MTAGPIGDDVRTSRLWTVRFGTARLVPWTWLDHLPHWRTGGSLPDIPRTGSPARWASLPARSAGGSGASGCLAPGSGPTWPAGSVSPWTSWTRCSGRRLSAPSSHSEPHSGETKASRLLCPCFRRSDSTSRMGIRRMRTIRFLPALWAAHHVAQHARLLDSPLHRNAPVPGLWKGSVQYCGLLPDLRLRPARGDCALVLVVPCSVQPEPRRASRITSGAYRDTLPALRRELSRPSSGNGGCGVVSPSPRS